MDENAKPKFLSAKDVAYIGLFTAVIAVCSFLTIPTTVPFTLQTFAIFLTLGILGGKRGVIAIFCYILLGTLGVPVFAGFKGGIGVILGATGGYIMGFLLCGLLYWLLEKLCGKSLIVMIISMVSGAILYFAFGTLWFMIIYTKNTGAIALSAVLGMCVVPFLLPDAIKITVAVLLSYKLRGKIK